MARWVEIAPILKRATDRTEGRYEPIDLLRLVMANHGAIWVVDDGGELLGAFFVEVRLYPAIQPRIKDLEISFLAGDQVEEWCGEFDDVMTALGREHGCKLIRVTTGRLGWARFCQARGFKVKIEGMTIVREL